MSTSIRDLLNAANDELHETRDGNILPQASAGVRAAALTTIGAAAPILTHLRRDGVQDNLDGIREHAVAGLATATRHVATATHGLPDSRAAQLLGAAGDVIGTLQHELGREDRWALALAVGDTVRRASTLYTSAGPSAPNRDVDWSRRAAVLLARRGGEHPPHPRHLIIQDRPVPDPIPGHATTPLAAAAQAVDNVTRLLERRTEPLALYHLKATTLLTQTTAHYLSAVAAAAAPRSADPEDRVTRSWRSVRHDLGVFHDGYLVHRDGRDQLLVWAARAHDTITQALGPADQITGRTVATLTTTDKTFLVEISNQLPRIATALWAQLKDVDGRAFARITDLPAQERRITEQIRRLPVIADGPDFITAHTSLRTAELLSARLAAELPARMTVPARQRNLATHYATITAAYARVHGQLPARRTRPEHRVVPGSRPGPSTSPDR